jgi:pheromone shutdown protein TraB
MKKDDAISAFFLQMSERYPQLPGPLVHERDLYLAWSLRRSKAVNGASTVVGVVGRGHLRGVVYALGADSGSLRFTDLVGGKNSKRARQQEAVEGLGKFALETVLFGGLIYAWMELFPSG